MAEEMTGIERLREAAETVCSRTVSKVAGGVVDVGRGRWMSGEELTDIAGRIEREHAEELAAAKRDMTDEAREAVERLRAIDDEWISSYDVAKAVGLENFDFGEDSDTIACSHRTTSRMVHLGAYARSTICGRMIRDTASNARSPRCWERTAC